MRQGQLNPSAAAFIPQRHIGEVQGIILNERC